MPNIYIRPLIEQDAYTSVHWRNNPEVWKFTGAKPDKLVTIAMELSWIKKAIKSPTNRRFAICIAETNHYIGNVQLTDIAETEAQFHIFIGEPNFWNQGIATQATKLILDFGFKTLKLSQVYLYVKENHKFAIKAYENSGFKATDSKDGFVKMLVKAS